jgi:hypothetical protein
LFEEEEVVMLRKSSGIHGHDGLDL